MPRTHWQKLLETCRRRGTDLLFIPGSPPLVRTVGQWRTLQLPPLDAAEVKSLAAGQLVGYRHVEADGYCYADFDYGTDTHFRAMAFGHPDYTMLIIAKIIDEPTPVTAPA